MSSPNWNKLAEHGIYPNGQHPVDTVLDASNDLSEVSGLGAASIKKLIKAGVNSQKELRALSDDDLADILGAATAGKVRKSAESED